MQSLLPFGLTQPPFVPPASRGQVFLAPAASRCVAALLDAVVEGRRAVGLSGDPGVGKTVLLGVAVEELRGWGIDVVRAAAPLPGPHGFQQMIGDAAGVHGAGAMEPAMLARAVAATGRTAPLVLAVDDAHTLDKASLRYLWLLASLLGFGPVKLQLVLVGRVELDFVLLAAELAPLRQAIGVTRLVPPLDDAEVVSYLDHKLRFAGSALGAVMSDAAVAELQQQAAGLPGEIDRFASHALAADPSLGRQRISRKAVAAAARGKPAAQGWRGAGAKRTLVGLAGGLTVAGLAVALVLSHPLAPSAPALDPLALATAPAAASAMPPEDAAMPVPVSGAAAPVAVPGTSVMPLRASDSAPDTDPAPRGRDVLIEHAPPPAEARPPAFEAPLPPAGKGLVLLAKAGDTVPTLYRQVYRGLIPPPYAEVAAANPSVPHPGDLLVFPAPPNGWRN